MPQLIQIGNSRGIRIPKSLIQQAGLEAKELEFIPVEDGLLIKPVTYQVRQEWAKQIKEALQTYSLEKSDADWLDAPLTDNDEWEW